MKEPLMGKCALCGRENVTLELHHIIPKLCRNKYFDPDRPDNLIAICCGCHGLLTPRSALASYGISLVKLTEKPAKEKATEFYTIINEMLESGELVDAVDVMDVHDKVYLGHLKKRDGNRGRKGGVSHEEIKTD